MHELNTLVSPPPSCSPPLSQGALMMKQRKELQQDDMEVLITLQQSCGHSVSPACVLSLSPAISRLFQVEQHEDGATKLGSTKVSHSASACAARCRGFDVVESRGTCLLLALCLKTSRFNDQPPPMFKFPVPVGVGSHEQVRPTSSAQLRAITVASHHSC